MTYSETYDDEILEYADSFINAVREPLIVLDHDLRVISASRSFYDVFKVKPEETLGSLIYDLGSRQWDIPELRQLLETLLPQKMILDDYELNHEFAGLGRRTMLFNAREIPRKYGKERLILLAIEDITERRKRDKLLSESEERYRRLFETANDGMVLLEKAEGRITHANPAVIEMLGYSHDELIGKEVMDIGFPGDIGIIQEIIQILEKDGILTYKDAPVRAKTGQVIYTDIYMVDKARLVQCNIRDITERKQAEEALRRSESYYRAIFETSGSAMFIVEEDTTISLVNSIFEELSGYPKQEVEGKKSWIEFVHPDDVDWMKKNHYLRRRNPGAAPRQYESGFITRNGEKRNILLTVTMIPGTNRSVASCIDITERKRAEQEREKLQSQLSQSRKLESVGRLAGGVAHDFNNMLTIINGYAEMMTDTLSPSEPWYDNALQIHEAGKRSAVIVRKLLAFARKQTISPEVMNLNDSLASMLNMLQQLIGENIELFWKPGQNSWLVKMDPSQLDQILVNLVVNARDAIADIGKITIETENIEFDEQYCESHTGFVPGPFVMLTVSDTGCGMDNEVIDNLFEPFFTTKEVGKGTGLGLPTVYGIVKQNSGFINVYSEPGHGTAFKIYLPRHAGKAAVSGKENLEEYPLGEGETILILEDEISVLNLAETMLEKLGYKVLASESAREALETVKSSGGMIDLLITDVIMPEMNGLDFTTRVNTFYPDIKTLFMSGYTSDVIVRHGILAEGLHYIQKPFSMKDLAVKVRKMIENEQ
ncbi:MAG: PAS domain S-box protein [Thermodesulfobacteriota bacterium]